MSIRVSPDDGFSKHHFVVEALRRHGIDGRFVIEDSIDENGYELIIRNRETGRPILGPDGDFVIHHRNWINKRVWEDVAGAMQLDQLRTFTTGRETDAER